MSTAEDNITNKAISNSIGGPGLSDPYLLGGLCLWHYFNLLVMIESSHLVD